MDLEGFQRRIAEVYLSRDAERGVPATVAWIAEEVGELAQAVRKGSPAQQLHELGDVLAWVASLANQLDLSLADAAARYAAGCPALRRGALRLLSRRLGRAPTGGRRAGRLRPG